MKQIRFYFFLILMGGFIHAQEKDIKGIIIIDLADSSPEGIYITNSRTNFSTITDLTGSFTIKAQAGDSLLIRSYFYESRRFYLTENLMKNDLLNIHLNLQPIALDEAVLTQKLTGFLDKDVKFSTKYDVVDKLYQELGVNPDASKLRDSSNFQLGKDVGIGYLNVEKLFETMTGDLRRRQNLYAFEGKESKISHIREYFGDEYFIGELDIPKEKIREFVFYAFETSQIPTYYQNGNFFYIMTELAKMAPVYLSRLNSWHSKN